MISTKVTKYIFLGTCLRFLQDIDSFKSPKIHGNGWVLFNIKELLENLDEINMPVTKGLTHDLNEFVKKVSTKDSNANLSPQEANELSNIISKIRPTLMSEAGLRDVFIVTEKRIEINKLLNDIPSLMPHQIFEKLPTIAKYDLKEAGKCIAFELPTSAAFHLLRATECVLRELYYFLVKRKRIVDPNWGQIVNAINGKRNVPIMLVSHLDNIRDSKRNPTQHPEKIYDMEEAQSLFGLCTDAMDQIYRIIS